MSPRTTFTGAEEPPWETLRRRLILWEDEAAEKMEGETEAWAWSDRKSSDNKGARQTQRYYLESCGKRI